MQPTTRRPPGSSVDPLERVREARRRAYRERGRSGAYRPGSKDGETPNDWTGLRVLVLPRVSSDEAQQGVSLDSQERRGAEEVEHRGGILVVVPDPGHPDHGGAPCLRWDTSSGRYFNFSTDEQGQLLERKRHRLRWALDHPDQWDMLLVTAKDRMHRSVLNWLKTMEWLAAHGKHVVSLDGFINTTTPTGRMMLIFSAGMAEIEPYTLVERFQAGKQQMMAAGDYAVGLRAPFGYVWSKPGRRGNPRYGSGDLVPDATVDERNGLSRAAIVQRIFARRAEGASSHVVAEELGWCSCTKRNPPRDAELAEAVWGSLNPRSVSPSKRQTPQRALKRGRPSAERRRRGCYGLRAVFAIVQNPTYFGEMSYGEHFYRIPAGRREIPQADGSVVVRTFTPLVTEALFLRANEPEAPVVKGGMEWKVYLPEALASWLCDEARRVGGISRAAALAVADNLTATPATRGPRSVAKQRVGFFLTPELSARVREEAARHGCSVASVVRGAMLQAAALHVEGKLTKEGMHAAGAALPHPKPSDAPAADSHPAPAQGAAVIEGRGAT